MPAKLPAKRRKRQALDLPAVVKSQYHAALGMFRQAIEHCPDDLWTAAGHANPIWHIAYHALFFTHYYMQPRRRSFKKWAQHRRGCEHLGKTPPTPYTRAEILAYCDLCDSLVDPTVDKLDLAAPDCDFPWYPMGKLEHQLVNLRHLQHHTAQLADRIGLVAPVKFHWIGGRPASPANTPRPSDRARRKAPAR